MTVSSLNGDRQSDLNPGNSQYSSLEDGDPRQDDLPLSPWGTRSTEAGPGYQPALNRLFCDELGSQPPGTAKGPIQGIPLPETSLILDLSDLGPVPRLPSPGLFPAYKPRATVCVLGHDEGGPEPRLELLPQPWEVRTTVARLHPADAHSCFTSLIWRWGSSQASPATYSKGPPLSYLPPTPPNSQETTEP